MVLRLNYKLNQGITIFDTKNNRKVNIIVRHIENELDILIKVDLELRENRLSDIITLGEWESYDITPLCKVELPGPKYNSNDLERIMLNFIAPREVKISERKMFDGSKIKDYNIVESYISQGR
ncbi:hypothetical protein J4407_00510 [Candidatus Pacearchaeota archaeon]|nr:hypothetical protein [Candidatus Pacearchaeota archaeon]